MTQQLALTEQNNLMPSATEWQTMLSMADVLVKSGFLPESVRSAPAALAIMLKGKELGIPPMQAFSSINIIKGKPALSAELMAALVLKAGHSLKVIESTDKTCTVIIQRRGDIGPGYKQSFTIQEAEAAGLLRDNRDGSAGMWKKYPAALLRARAISAACRVVCPDVIMGMHTAEEMGAVVEMTEEGQEIIVATDQPQATNRPIISIVPNTATVPEPEPEETSRPEPMSFDEFGTWFYRVTGHVLDKKTGADYAGMYSDNNQPSMNEWQKVLRSNHNRDPYRKMLKAITIGCKNFENGQFDWNDATGLPVAIEQDEPGEIEPAELEF